MRWKRVVLLNVCFAVGCVVALFIVPPNTSLRLFLWICIGSIIVFNAAIVVVPKIQRAPADARRNWFGRWQIWIALAFLLLLEFLVSHGYVPKVTIK